jgi:hypothetical protein
VRSSGGRTEQHLLGGWTSAGHRMGVLTRRIINNAHSPTSARIPGSGAEIGNRLLVAETPQTGQKENCEDLDLETVKIWLP